MLQVYIVLVTLICCMVPFFGDFAALVGAIGFTPLVRTCCAGIFYRRTHLELRACLFEPMSRYLPGLTSSDIFEFLYKCMTSTQGGSIASRPQHLYSIQAS